MYNDIEIRIFADDDTLMNELGYGEYEIEDSDEIELERGNSYDTVYIEDDGTFEIPDGYQGEIDSDQDFDILVEVEEGCFVKEPLGYISPGRYKIENNCIQRIGKCNQCY